MLEKNASKEEIDRFVRDLRAAWQKVADDAGIPIEVLIEGLCEKCGEYNRRKAMGLPVSIREFFGEDYQWNGGKPFSPHQSIRTKAIRKEDIDAT